MKPPFIRLDEYVQGVNREQDTITFYKRKEQKKSDTDLSNTVNTVTPVDILADEDVYLPIPRLIDRSSYVVDNFNNKFFNVHNGKTYKRLMAITRMTGFRFGQFVFCKKLGKSIHDSQRNAKKRAKMRRKITQKKARRSSPGSKTKKSTSSKTKK
jgi:ribosomal protein S19